MIELITYSGLFALGVSAVMFFRWLWSLSDTPFQFRCNLNSQQQIRVIESPNVINLDDPEWKLTVPNPYKMIDSGRYHIFNKHGDY